MRIFNSKGDSIRLGTHIDYAALPYEMVWEIKPKESSPKFIFKLNEFYSCTEEERYVVRYAASSIPEMWQRNLWIFTVPKKDISELLELMEKHGYKQEDESRGWLKRQWYLSERAEFAIVKPTGEEEKAYREFLKVGESTAGKATFQKMTKAIEGYEEIIRKYPNTVTAEISSRHILSIYASRFGFTASQIPVPILRKKCYEFLERYPNSYFGIDVVSFIANVCGFSMEEKIAELERLGQKYKTEHIQYGVDKELKEQKEKLEQIKRGTYIGPEGPRYPRKKKGASPISVQILSYFWSFRNIELVVIFPEQVTQKILIAFGARLK
ncbi:MAG: hypothetical protein AB1393_13510, partial [Candidatus Edwardsbacteria bacterium]